MHRRDGELRKYAATTQTSSLEMRDGMSENCCAIAASFQSPTLFAVYHFGDLIVRVKVVICLILAPAFQRLTEQSWRIFRSMRFVRAYVTLDSCGINRLFFIACEDKCASCGSNVKCQLNAN